MNKLTFLHPAVGDEHLPQVLEQPWPAEGAVGYGGGGHLRDGADAQQLVLRVADQGAHQLPWGEDAVIASGHFTPDLRQKNTVTSCCFAVSNSKSHV